MSGLKIGAILLIIAGTLGLVYGRFSYDVNVPVWAAAGAIVAGSLLLLARKRSHRP